MVSPQPISSGRPTDRNPGEKRLDSLAVRLIVADAP
jgi:hypothetical protein